MSSANYVHTLFGPAPKVAAHIVISLGVNDDPSAHTLEMLRLMRRQLRAGTVTWLLPGLREGARRAIGAVAAENGDRLVDTRAQAGPDGLHPTGAGYRQIAASALGGGAARRRRRRPVLRAAAASAGQPGAVATDGADCTRAAILRVRLPLPAVGTAQQRTRIGAARDAHPAGRPAPLTRRQAGTRRLTRPAGWSGNGSQSEAAPQRFQQPGSPPFRRATPVGHPGASAARCD